MFNIDTRPKFAEKTYEGGKLEKMAGLMKDIAAEWEKASPATKKEYEEKAKADKERFTREMAEYEKKNPEAVKAHKEAQQANRKKKRDKMTKGPGSQLYKKKMKELEKNLGVPP